MTVQTHPTVVVGVDGSAQSLLALDLAADEAARRHQPLRMVAAFLWPLAAPTTFVPDGGFTDHALDSAHQMLEDAAATIRSTHPELEVTTAVILGSPSGVLVSESERASLVVVGHRGHGGFASLLTGSVATQVATHAQSPVIIVRPSSNEGGANTRPVVVGVDGRDFTEAAIAFAFDEASARRVPLTAVSVWTQPANAEPDPFKPVAYDYDEARGQANRQLSESLAGFPEKYPDVTVRRELIHGLDAAHELRQASAEAGLIVVGSRGRGELAGLFLGSVGQTLVHHAKCPVAIVHTNAA